MGTVSLGAGIHDISADVYHSDPAPEPSLSASLVKVLVQDTPQHAWVKHPRLNPNFEHVEEDKFDIGNSAHSLMLGDVKKFAVLPFKDFKTDAAKKARDDARHNGLIPLTAEKMARVISMVGAGREQLDGSADFSSVFKNGKPEQTLIWSEGDGADKVWMRLRLDWLPDDHTAPFDDYKTTEVADPAAWSRSIMFSVRHDIQAAFYRRGIRALGLNRQPKMRFILQEPSEPFCLSGVELSGEILELADREIERAIRRWRWCRANDSWPGFPARFHRAEMPEYLETRRMEREVRDDDAYKAARERGQKVDPDLLAQSFRFQSPI